MPRSAPHSSDGPATSAAATAVPDPEPREAGFFRRWIVDPLRSLWLGATAPHTRRAPSAENDSSLPPGVHLGESVERVLQRCRRAPLLPDSPRDWDLLLALIDEPTLESLWHATSSDVDRLRAHIREAAIALDDEDLLASPPLDRIVRAAIFHAMSAGSSVVEAHHLLVRMWPIALEDEPDPMLALLEKHGLTLAAVTTFIAHGVAAHEEWSDATAPAGEPLAVEMLNDDYTPQEVVVHILEDVVRLSPTDAYRLMLKVHMDGRTAVTVLPRNEAIALANAVLAEARNAGAPLKVVLTPPTTAESEGHDATFRAT